MSASRSDHLALGYSSHSASQNRSNSPSATNSPIDPLSTTARSVFGLPGSMNSSSIISSNTRSGTGSPSHEMAGSSRLFSKRFVAQRWLRLSSTPKTRHEKQHRAFFFFCLSFQGKLALQFSITHLLTIIVNAQGSRDPGSRRRPWLASQSMGRATDKWEFDSSPRKHPRVAHRRLSSLCSAAHA